MPMPRAAIGWMMACLLLASAGPASAAEPDEADAAALYEEGMRAMAAQDFATAAAKFDRAYAKRPDPVLLWNAARAHHQAGNLEQARARYHTCLASEGFPADKRKSAEDYLAQVELALRQRDEAARPQPEGPKPPPERSADVRVGPETRPAAGPGWAPWVVAGGGVVLAAVGVALHFVAEGQRDDLRAALSDPPAGYVDSMTQVEAWDREAEANTLDTLGAVGIGLGGAAIATGVIWLIVASGDEEPGRGSVHVSGFSGRDGHGLVLGGRF